MLVLQYSRFGLGLKAILVLVLTLILTIHDMIFKLIRSLFLSHYTTVHKATLVCTLHDGLVAKGYTLHNI